jgi:preprotein translocase subunit Sss1
MNIENIYTQSAGSEEEMEIKLWEYIDGITEDPERSIIERLIKENEIWRSKYQELLEVHQLVQESELEHPSMRFTKNVMEEIGRLQIAPAAKEYINNKVIWGVAIFMISVIVGFLIYGFSQINWSQASNTNATLGIDLTNVDYSKMFSNSFVNIFMMLNVVLGLMLFDRYLSNKKKNLIKNT